LLDSRLPDPGLPYFIGQIEADPNLKKLPVLILAIPDTVEARDILDRYTKEQAHLTYLISQSKAFRQARLEAKKQFDAAQKSYLDSSTSNIREQVERLAAVEDTYQAKLREVARQLPQEAVFDKQAQGIERTLSDLANRFEAESSRRAAALTRWAAPYANVQIISQRYLDDTRQLRTRLLGENQAALKPLSEAEQRDYTEKAMRLLAQMAKDDGKNGYDLRGAEKAIFSAVRGGALSPEGQLVGVATLAKFRGAEAQTELAAVITDAKRPLPVRIKATDELIRHFQVYTPLLTGDEIRALRTLADQSTTQGDLKELRPHLSALIGSLRPDENATGERLRAFPLPSPGTPDKPVEKPPMEKPPEEKPAADKPAADKPPPDK
jgi:hypothetical protein